MFSISRSFGYSGLPMSFVFDLPKYVIDCFILSGMFKIITESIRKSSIFWIFYQICQALKTAVFPGWNIMGDLGLSCLLLLGWMNLCTGKG